MPDAIIIGILGTEILCRKRHSHRAADGCVITFGSDIAPISFLPIPPSGGAFLLKAHTAKEHMRLHTYKKST
jgi:hypothetical protein